jgi:hypothetical protein
MAPKGEIEIEGYAIPKSNMVKSLQYLVLGSRGRKKPEGTDQLAEILRESGVKPSSFPPAIRPLLGGADRKTRSVLRPGTVNFTPARRRHSIQNDDEVDRLATNLESHWTLSDDDEQSGSGLVAAHLNAACDHAKCGDLDEVLLALEEAGQRGATATQLNKAKKYIASVCIGE